ncbi:MAG TPA: Lrp/AsnC family transcriptional regulator [Caulobacteraceae bacterium]|nr:Lrp/AsnC family transcriptional regulator [Caulobacteraceae bacterium]
MKLDQIDKRILRVLQRDGRIQNIDLAREVGLSPSPCLRRVRLLEEAGVIERYVAVIDGAKVGLGLTVFARVWFKAQDADSTAGFIEAIRKIPEVMECHLMVGDCDALLRIMVEDLNAYWRLQADRLARIDNVRNVKTDVPLATVKRSFEAPL